MKKKWDKKPSMIDVANYNYLKDLPIERRNLITQISIVTLEKKYPELKS